jgi:hypothetical protein
MHGLEASPSAWLQNHAHWGRYLVLALSEVGKDIGGENAASKGAFFPGKVAHVAWKSDFPREGVHIPDPGILLVYLQ